MKHNIRDTLFLFVFVLPFYYYFLFMFVEGSFPPLPTTPFFVYLPLHPPAVLHWAGERTTQNKAPPAVGEGKKKSKICLRKVCWLGEEMGGRWRGLLQLINAMQFYCCPFLVQNEKEGKNTHLHNIERARLCPNFPSQIWSKKCSQRTRNYQPFSFSICCFIPVRRGQQQELNKLPFSTPQTSRNWLLAGQFLMIFHQTILLLAIFMQNSKP